MPSSHSRCSHSANDPQHLLTTAVHEKETVSKKRAVSKEPAESALIRTKPSAENADLMVSGSLAFWLKVISIGVISLVAFESVAVTTAMPYVVEALHGEQFYALASGISLSTQLITTALAGKWCDAKDPRHVLYVGMVAFIIGLIVATAAPTITVLIIGRGIQGLGGGLLVVPFYVMIGAYVKTSKQPAFFAAFAMAWVLPSLIGPVIAGLFVDHIHWRFVFGICPILYCGFTPLLLSKLRKFPAIHPSRPLHFPPQLVGGACISGCMIALLQIISGTEPSHMNGVLVAGVCAVTVVLIFSARFLFPRGTFHFRRGVPAAVAVRMILNGTFIATELYLPLLLKEVHHWGATQAGFVITTSSITWALGSWLQGRIADTRYRRLIPVVAPSVQLVGMLLTLVALLPHVSGWFVLIGWLIGGFGVGLIYPALAVHALALTPQEKHGKISSALSVGDTLGSSAFVAYGGILYALFYSLGNGAFAVVIGCECLIAFSAVVMAQRVGTSERAF